MASRIAIKKGKTNLSIDDFMECIYTIRHKDIKRDNSDDENYVRNLIENGIELKIVGIVRPEKNSVADSISTVIGYTSALTRYVINQINQRRKNGKI